MSDIFNNLAVSFKLYSCYDVTSTCDNDLSVAINRLCEWSDTWQLSIAALKCFTCSICSHRPVAVSQRQVYKIKNTILPSVDSVKDLGVMVDHHLKFDIRISLAVHKAMLRSRLILKCFPPVTKIYCSKRTLLRSDLSLNTVVLFGHHTLKNLIYKIESVQKFFFTKRLPGLWDLPYPKRL